MPGCGGHKEASQFALLYCTQPGRGKSQVIEHNRALPKVGQSLRRASLGGLPLRALRVRVMVGYVLRPSPDNSYVSLLCSACYSGATRKVALIPRPPGGSACGGSHCVARFRLGSTAPVRPAGTPQTQDRRLASADFLITVPPAQSSDKRHSAPERR